MFDRIQGRLRVEGVEAGLEQQQIHTSVYQPSDLNLERLRHPVK